MKDFIKNFLKDCSENLCGVFTKEDLSEILKKNKCEDSVHVILNELEEDGFIESISVYDANPDELRSLCINPDCLDAYVFDEDDEIIYRVKGIYKE